jgi:hypothetical protein
MRKSVRAFSGAIEQADRGDLVDDDEVVARFERLMHPK